MSALVRSRLAGGIGLAGPLALAPAGRDHDCEEVAALAAMSIADYTVLDATDEGA
jgi:hypothetical protein